MSNTSDSDVVISPLALSAGDVPCLIYIDEIKNNENGDIAVDIEARRVDANGREWYVGMATFCLRRDQTVSGPAMKNQPGLSDLLSKIGEDDHKNIKDFVTRYALEYGKFKRPAKTAIAEVFARAKVTNVGTEMFPENSPGFETCITVTVEIEGKKFSLWYEAREPEYLSGSWVQRESDGYTNGGWVIARENCDFDEIVAHVASCADVDAEDDDVEAELDKLTWAACEPLRAAAEELARKNATLDDE